MKIPEMYKDMALRTLKWIIYIAAGLVAWIELSRFLDALTI